MEPLKHFFSASLVRAIGESLRTAWAPFPLEAFVAAGLGIGLLPRYTTRPSPDVVLRPLADVPATRWIVALSRPDRARRAVVARVIEELRAAAPSAADAG